MAEDERLTISVEEAARILGISRASGYAAAQVGAFPVLRVGRRLVVPRARFLRWLDGQETSPVASREPVGAGR